MQCYRVTQIEQCKAMQQRQATHNGLGDSEYGDPSVHNGVG